MKAKQRVVIKPNSIHVADIFDSELATIPNSIFSDGYDFFTERKRLKPIVDLVEVSEPLETDPNFTAYDIYRSHEILLKTFLLRKIPARKRSHKRIRSLNHINLDDYVIFTSDDENYKSVGKLDDDKQDSVFVHTKQAVRLWDGFNDKKQWHKRWPGIRYAMKLTDEIIFSVRQDNPFAHVSLIELESIIDNVQSHLNEMNALVDVQLKEVESIGISIHIFENLDPLALQVDQIRGYGFKLLQILTSYDLFVRGYKTLSSKGILPNNEVNSIIHLCTSKIRALLIEIYNTAMKTRVLKNVSRKLILDDDADAISKLQIAIDSGVLSQISMEVLMYVKNPKYIFLNNPYDEKEIALLVEKAQQYGVIKV